MRPIDGGRSEVAQFRPYSRLMYQPSVSIFILCCSQASGDDSIMLVRFRCRAMKPNISLRSPVSVVIATREAKVIGFAGYECTRRNFFGPTGVIESERGRGIGKALLISALWGLREMGYVYGVIGGAGPVEFYQAAVGAIVIPDSEPGIYVDLLK